MDWFKPNSLNFYHEHVVRIFIFEKPNVCGLETVEGKHILLGQRLCHCPLRVLLCHLLMWIPCGCSVQCILLPEAPFECNTSLKVTPLL